MEPEIASISQEQRKLAENLKETLNILDNIKVKNEDSLEYIKEPIDDLMSKLKYLPVEPSFNILPPEIKTKILGYLSTNEARTAASVCQEWKDILLMQNPIPLMQNPILLMQNPILLMQNPILLMQNPIPLMQNPIPLMQNPILLMQNPTNQQGRKSSKKQWPFKELTRFCHKRFVLDLIAGLLLCLLTVNRDEPVQLRTGIQQAGVMLLFFFYWLEEYKNDDGPDTVRLRSLKVGTIVVLDIGTTILSWAISTCLKIYMYKSAQVQCVAVLIQFLFFTAFDYYADYDYYNVYMLPRHLAFSKQSFVSIPFWAISFYLVGVYEYAPAVVLIVATFSIIFFSVLASHIRGERT